MIRSNFELLSFAYRQSSKKSKTLYVVFAILASTLLFLAYASLSNDRQTAFEALALSALLIIITPLMMIIKIMTSPQPSFIDPKYCLPQTTKIYKTGCLKFSLFLAFVLTMPFVAQIINSNHINLLMAAAPTIIWIFMIHIIGFKSLVTSFLLLYSPSLKIDNQEIERFFIGLLYKHSILKQDNRDLEDITITILTSPPFSISISFGDEKNSRLLEIYESNTRAFITALISLITNNTGNLYALSKMHPITISLYPSKISNHAILDGFTYYNKKIAQ